jgi:hypothetical protein
VILGFALPAIAQTDNTQPSQEALLRRMQELETQMSDLRSQLATMKQQETTTSGTTESHLLTSSSSTSSPPPQSLAGLLGPTSLSGFVDMYYNYNSNQPASRTNGFRSFDGLSNQFALNLVELVIDKPPEATNSRTGYHLALGFGQAMNAVNSTEAGGLGFDQYLKEAYFSYLAPVGKGLQIDAGKFVTQHGYEVIETKDNWNYSRSLLFALAIPYYHAGLRTTYAPNDKFTLAGLVLNGWNNVLQNNHAKTVGLSGTFKPTAAVTILENYLAGPELSGAGSEWRSLTDTVLTYTASPQLSLALNYDAGRQTGLTWQGVAAYVRYQPTAWFALTPRYEFFDDTDGWALIGQNVQELTLTAELKFRYGALMRLEYRGDFAADPIFIQGASGLNRKQNVFTVGWVYAFRSKP